MNTGKDSNGRYWSERTHNNTVLWVAGDRVRQAGDSGSSVWLNGWLVRKLRNLRWLWSDDKSHNALNFQNEKQVSNSGEYRFWVCETLETRQWLIVRSELTCVADEADEDLQMTLSRIPARAWWFCVFCSFIRKLNQNLWSVWIKHPDIFLCGFCVIEAVKLCHLCVKWYFFKWTHNALKKSMKSKMSIHVWIGKTQAAVT